MVTGRILTMETVQILLNDFQYYSINPDVKQDQGLTSDRTQREGNDDEEEDEEESK